MKSTYDEKILKLWKTPKNYGELQNSTLKHSEENRICGDDMCVYLRVEDGIIKDAKFVSTGCLICIVFASELTETIKKMKIEEVLKMTDKEFLKLLDIEVPSLKIPCANLPLKAVQNCLIKGGKK